MAKVLIDPITRIEGHLSIEIDVENGKVVDAKSIGDMFRGYEKIFQGRNPLDANQLTQRICGVCPISHGIASSKCLEGAFGIKPNNNGRILRNLMLAANYMHSHLIHFYHLAALDFVDITALLKYNGGDSKMNNLKAWVESEVKAKKGRIDAITAGAPFLPRYEGNFYIKDVDTNIDAIAGYVKALEMRMKAHKMVAAIGGRAPHAIGLVPGGVTQVPTRAMIREYKKHIREIENFINDVYMNHVIAVAKTFKDYFKIGSFTNFLSYGLFEQDAEEKKYLHAARRRLRHQARRLRREQDQGAGAVLTVQLRFEPAPLPGTDRAAAREGRRLYLAQGAAVRREGDGSRPAGPRGHQLPVRQRRGQERSGRTSENIQRRHIRGVLGPGTACRPRHRGEAHRRGDARSGSTSSK